MPLILSTNLAALAEAEKFLSLKIAGNSAPRNAPAPNKANFDSPSLNKEGPRIPYMNRISMTQT